MSTPLGASRAWLLLTMMGGCQVDPETPVPVDEGQGDRVPRPSRECGDSPTNRIPERALPVPDNQGNDCDGSGGTIRVKADSEWRYWSMHVSDARACVVDPVVSVEAGIYLVEVCVRYLCDAGTFSASCGGEALGPGEACCSSDSPSIALEGLDCQGTASDSGTLYVFTETNHPIICPDVALKVTP